MTPAERRFALPHIELAALAWGDPAQRPLLALHGWLDNAASFARLAPLLRDRYVVAIDLAGHGRSQHRPLHAWYHYVDYFDDVRALVEQLGWSRFDLLGHSLGGTLASIFAAAYPERVGALATIESLGPLTQPADRALDQLRRALDQRAAYAEKSLRVHAGLDRAIDARVEANDLSPDAARLIVERGVKPVEGGFVWSSDPRLTLASPTRYTEDQVHAMLAGIRAPTRLVLAEPATSYLPAAMMDARAARVADIDVVRIPGHHHLHLDAAPAVAEAINGFFAGRGNASAHARA